ncbi:auxin response factor 17-like [Aristolochia californica]|uniref:auxin response factor 17-like n=1 Tax=Aristolochia californica TaxID=171875 RepID=UPI0035DBB268
MANELRSVDPHIWKACAGSSVQIPTVGSRVYYFPQGHGEQSVSPPEFRPHHPAYVLSRILSVRFLANPETDEVFAKLRLEPLPLAPPGLACPASPGEADLGEDPTIVPFSKTLTPSDANNGGGFSVPRFCADSIFPPLDYQAEPPVQNISVRDVHGVLWEFRHIYRGTPRRHLLTTGWSKFVNQKKLVAGDSVVFMKNKSRELFVGVRRTVRSAGVADSGGRWNSSILTASKLEDGDGEGFSRSHRGRVSAVSVLDATELAGSGRVFDVVYYPRAGSPDFVVPAHAVEDAMKVYWSVGMRVKMTVETEDSSRMTWFQGSIQAVGVHDGGLCRSSPWRMLQVNWHEPEVLHNVKSVSPWQVELVTTAPHIQNPFSSPKKLCLPPGPELFTHSGGSMFFPAAGLTSSVMSHLSPSVLSYNTFPAGMQGARHDTTFVPNLTNFVSNESGLLFSDNLPSYESSPKLSSVCTELNIGGSSQSENSSPLSQGSVNFANTETMGSKSRNSSTESSGGSFQLFGKIIWTSGNAGSNDDGAGGKRCKEAENLGGRLDPSISSYPYRQLYNQLDVSCQRVSALETCTL